MRAMVGLIGVLAFGCGNDRPDFGGAETDTSSTSPDTSPSETIEPMPTLGGSGDPTGGAGGSSGSSGPLDAGSSPGSVDDDSVDDDSVDGTDAGAAQEDPEPAPNPDDTPAPGAGGVPQTPACADECCGNEDCANGFSCVDSSCVCNQGTKACGDGCITDNQCCTDDDCPSGGQCSGGACSCPSGSHLCADACVSDASPDSCGAACDPCQAPLGGTASCDGSKCIAECPPSQKLCAGSCIAEAAPCDAECPMGSHDCDGVCALQTSTLACGTSCTPCPVPSHAVATCDGTSCGFECLDNYKRCGEDCIADGECCADMDCTGSMVCTQNACVCPTGQKLCDGSCIAEEGCCANTECGVDRGCVAHVCVDTASPQVVSFSPANGAKGVSEGANIVITFSEAMDKASVTTGVLSLTGTSLSAGNLSWNAAGTVLTIDPSSVLVYQAGSDQTSPAKQYTISVSNAAKDVAGNPLTGTSSATFSTLRRITQTLTPSGSPAGVAEHDTYGFATGLGSIGYCPTASGNVHVNWWTGGVSSGTRYAFIRYDLSSLGNPNSLGIQVESATFHASQAAPTDNFYTSGRTYLQKLEPGPLVNEVMDYPVNAQLGQFTSSAAASPSMNVTSSLTADWLGGDAVQLFRITQENSSGTDTAPEDGAAWFACTGFNLVLVYLIP